MTWEEFKAMVDKELEAKGIKQDTEIWYIDISFPDKSLTIGLDEIGLAIVN